MGSTMIQVAGRTFCACFIGWDGFMPHVSWFNAPWLWDNVTLGFETYVDKRLLTQGLNGRNWLAELGT